MFKIKNIPPQYLAEFISRQILFLKNRTQLFTVLVFGLYFLVVFLSLFVLYPEEFKTEEIGVWIMLTVGSVLILYSNNKAGTLGAAKLNAYIFITFLLLILTKVCMIYVEYAAFSSSLFVFLLFLVAISMPLKPVDLIAISLMHVAAYAVYFLYVDRFYQGNLPVPFNIKEFYDGVTYLAMACLLCVIIRHKEMTRDIENFILLKDVEDKNKKMQEELELARRIHQTLIPRSISTDLADIAVLYLPMRYIGGDYTRFHFVEGDKLIFIISDITGHGVSAALLVNRIHTEFERLAKEVIHPGVLLKELDTFIRNDFGDINMYLSAFCGFLDFKRLKFLYSNYAHPPQYIYRVTSSLIQPLESQTSLLGLSTSDDTIYQHEISFDRGDMILLFTDGIIETRNANGEEYGRERMESFIRKNCNITVNLFNQKLLDELNGYKDKDFRDDISMLSIKIK